MSSSRHVLALLVLSILLAATVAATSMPAATHTLTATWVVEFDPLATVSERALVLDRDGVQVRDVMAWSRFALVETDQATAETLAEDTWVEQVRPPMAVEASARPNDPHFDRQWNLPVIQAPTAWDITTGTGVVVAVLDTGVDRSLSDLQGTRFTGGFDFIDNDADPHDDHGHGTHVAGTIAQTTNNGIGVAGVAHGATVMPVRVLDTRGAGNDYVLAQGIHFAAVNGADVINLSLGGAGSTATLYEAIQYAASAGVTIVAAVGNDGADTINYPAAYGEVLAVGAVDQALARAPYSNRGDALDLVAPGGDTSADLDGDGYGDGILQQTFTADGTACFCFYEGTSMAAPHVAGAAALIVAEHGPDAATVREALVRSARDLGPAGHDPSFGAGLVQAAAALQAAADITAPAPDEPTPPPTEDPIGEPLPEADSPTLGQARDIDDACPAGEVPDAGFADVDDTSAHGRAIDCVAWRDITQGIASGRYGPTVGVTRAQMASFLAAAITDAGGALPSSPPNAFTDDDSSPHAPNIDRLAAAGIVKGQLDATYGPTQLVTRGQMATFLARTVAHLTGEGVFTRIDYFDDDTDNLHAEQIDAMAEVGVATGVDLRTYAPARTVRRDQMASFLARALDHAIETRDG